MPNGLARSSLLSAVASFLTTLATFASSVLIAHLLGVRPTGQVLYALWCITILATVADFGVQSTLTRFISELSGQGKSDQAAGLALSLYRRLLLGVAGTSAIIVLLACFAGQEPGTLQGPVIWALIGAGTALLALANANLGFMRGHHQFLGIAKITGAALLVQVAAIAAGSVAFGVHGALAGYVAGSVVAALASIKIKAQHGELNEATAARASRYATYAWLANIAAALIWSRVEIFFLELSSGPEAVALFAVALTLSSLATQGPMLLTGALLPHFSTRTSNENLDRLRNTYATGTRLMAFLAFPACLGTAAITPVFLPMIYGRHFADAVPIAEILVAGSAFTAVSAVGANVIWAMERSDFTLRSNLIGAAMSIAVGLLIIPHYGLIGAAIGRIAVQGTIVVLSWLFMARTLKVPTPLMASARLFAAAALCAGTARAVLWLLPSPGAAGLALAIGCAAIVYFVAVRLLGALAPGDYQALRSIAAALPPPLDWLLRRFLALLQPIPA